MTQAAEHRFPQSFASLSPSFREEWRPVVGYAGLYVVSSLGRVYSARTGRILHGTRTRCGYSQVRLTPHLGKPRCHLIHSLVAAAFIGPRQPGHVIDHVNGVKTWNVVTNLEYVTQRENIRRAVSLGLLRPSYFQSGAQNPNARLDEDKVRHIRLLRSQGVPAAEVAALYGVSTVTVHRVAKRTVWRHVA